MVLSSTTETSRLMPARRRSLGVALGSAAAGASWMALVAATTVGLPELQSVRAEVRVGADELPREPREPSEARDEYRLVVQSYAAGSLIDGVPSGRARPLASAQRSVTAEELSRGIAIDVMAMGIATEGGESPVIVAWVERGAPNLEFDGRRARPSRDAFVGTAQTDAEHREARLTLSRRVA